MKLATALIASMVLALILAACSPGGPPEPAPTAIAPPASAPPPAVPTQAAQPTEAPQPSANGASATDSAE